MKIHIKPKEDVAKATSSLGLVRVTGVEPALLAKLDPKSSASANSAIPAYSILGWLVPPYPRISLSHIAERSSASAYQGYALMHKNFVLASMRSISFRHTRVFYCRISPNDPARLHHQGYALMHKNFVLASMRGISFRHTRVELIIARRCIFVKVFRQLIVAE